MEWHCSLYYPRKSCCCLCNRK